MGNGGPACCCDVLADGRRPAQTSLFLTATYLLTPAAGGRWSLGPQRCWSGVPYAVALNPARPAASAYCVPITH